MHMFRKICFQKFSTDEKRKKMKNIIVFIFPKLDYNSCQTFAAVKAS